MRAGVAAGVRADVVREDGESTAHQVDGTVGVAAGTAPVHLGQPAVQSPQESGIGLAAGEARHVVSDGRQAVDARPALAGALLGQVVRDASCLGDAAGVRSEDDHDAHACGGADGAQ